MARYTTFCTGSTILLQYLFDVLPAATIKALRHPSHGLTLHTLESATTALLALYDTLTPEDLSELRQQCLKPYVSSECMRTYTATHTTIHDTCANNKQPYPEQDKITLLLNGISPCGLFKDYILHWRITHSRVDQQKYNDLVQAVRTWADLIGKTTTGALGYSAAVTPTPAPSTPLAPTDIAAIAAAVHQLNLRAPPTPPPPRHVLQGRGVQRAPGRFSGRIAHMSPRAPVAVGAPRPIYPPNYCWTHGAGHSGTHCRYPAPGHQAHATFANKMGGHP